MFLQVFHAVVVVRSGRFWLNNIGYTMWRYRQQNLETTSRIMICYVSSPTINMPFSSI